MPERKSQKAKVLLSTAHDLFLRHGVRRVSVEEICREAGVSKMTFYKHFGDKTEIAKQVLDGLWEGWREMIALVMHGERPFEEKIQKLMSMKMEISKELSQDFMTEVLSGASPELREHVAAHTARNMKEMRAFLAKGQADGAIKSNLNIDFLLLLLIKMRELYADEAMQAMYPDAASFIKEAFTVFYYGALAREGEDQ